MQAESSLCSFTLVGGEGGGGGSNVPLYSPPLTQQEYEEK